MHLVINTNNEGNNSELEINDRRETEWSSHPKETVERAPYQEFLIQNGSPKA